jgi:hypothetical protein
VALQWARERETTLNQLEAEKALGIIRQVIQNTREDLVAHNWGKIWLIHSFTNAAACWAGWWIEVRELPVWAYLIPLAVAGLANILFVLVLVTRDQGVRSYVEWQIHGIWVTFIVFTALFTIVLHVTGADPKLFGPLFALTSGMSFAMMGVVFSRQMPYAFLFLAVMLAGPYLPGVQWGLIALLWWSALFLPGLAMYREKRRRDQDASTAKLL